MTIQLPACTECKAEDMDEFACDVQSTYCLDCCSCLEHLVDEHHPTWRE